jgi:hypothetical protein
MRALVADDREAFHASETRLREASHHAPFGRLAARHCIKVGKAPIVRTNREACFPAYRKWRILSERCQRSCCRGQNRALELILPA